MNIETTLIKEFNTFMKANSIFSDKLLILPDTPQSFSTFPTIIFREMGNVDSSAYKTTNRLEYGEDLTYQVDIYTKNVVLGNTTYNSKIVINEIKELVAKFFRNCGFDRISNNPNDYIDISVKRQTMIFSATINSWNKKLN